MKKKSGWKRLITACLSWFRRPSSRLPSSVPPITEAQRIPRNAHGISRKNISPYALKVLYRLHQAGFEACLVGGGVRDLLLGKRPKDFDVATNASPEQVKHLFKNCRLIGRRFRLAHVFFGPHIVEVATFRRNVDTVFSDEGRILRDNAYGTMAEDAWRRDFTINALYYNIADFSLVDPVGGMSDLKDHCIRVIGDPELRYREDPVRMLRAIRFAAKLGFHLHPKTAAPLATLANLLQKVPAARLFEECLKCFFTGHSLDTYEALQAHGLFGVMFSKTQASFADPKTGKSAQTWIRLILENTDQRIKTDQSVNPAFWYAALLWYPYQHRWQRFKKSSKPAQVARLEAMQETLMSEKAELAPPKRLWPFIQEIWSFQNRFLTTQPRKVSRCLSHPRFKAAYDFLLLRANVEAAQTKRLATWWTEQLQSKEKRNG